MRYCWHGTAVAAGWVKVRSTRSVDSVRLQQNELHYRHSLAASGSGVHQTQVAMAHDRWCWWLMVQMVGSRDEVYDFLHQNCLSHIENLRHYCIKLDVDEQ